MDENGILNMPSTGDYPKRNDLESGGINVELTERQTPTGQDYDKPSGNPDDPLAPPYEIHDEATGSRRGSVLEGHNATCSDSASADCSSTSRPAEGSNVEAITATHNNRHSHSPTHAPSHVDGGTHGSGGNSGDMPAAIGRETCPICIVDFEEGDDLRVLPCEGKHVFHQTCVDPWLLELSSSCPICRQGPYLRNLFYIYLFVG